MLEIKLKSQNELFRPCLDYILNALVELSSFFLVNIATPELSVYNDVDFVHCSALIYPIRVRIILSVA